MSQDDKKPSDQPDKSAEKKDYTRPLGALAGQKPPAPDWFTHAIETPSEEGSVEVKGALIRYSAWGEVGKRGLLFIHGGRAHRNWWRPLAPFFTDKYRVAALDLSGMGDSDWRPRYSMDLIIDEIFAVIEAAGLNEAGRPLVVGHSFGGWSTLAAVERGGERLSGAVVIDSPLGVPDPTEGYKIANGGKKKDETAKEGDAAKASDAPTEKPKEKKQNRIYDTIEEPISRFRLLPNQDCEQLYYLDYIAREGLIKAPKPEGGAGWTWKFDPGHGENFDIHFERDLLLAPRCPLAFIYGQQSAFANGEGFDHLRGQLEGRAPLLMMPAAHHHLMMDQPIAVVSTLRMLFSCWPIRVGAA